MFLTITTMLGLPGLFGSRVFLPMFAAAVAVRFGPLVPWLGDLGALAGAGEVPAWFTDDLTLIALGVLSLVEVLAQKNPDARAVLNWVDRYAKPALAALTAFGLISTGDAAAVQDRLGRPDEASALAVGGAMFVAAATFVVAAARAAVLDVAADADDADDTGLFRLVSWAEDLWATFGVLFLLLFPAVMLALIGLALLGLFALQRRAAAREEAAKFACPACGRPMYRPALACPHCGNPNPRPASLNWLGAATDRPAGADQPSVLLAKGRCPRCATRLDRRTTDQSCDACGLRPFDDPARVAALDRHVAGKLPVTLLACAAMSAVPVVGLIPGVILYRLRLVAPYRRYVGRGRAMLTRVAARVLFVLLIAFQWVPVAGALTVPAMALLGFAAYRRAFEKSLTKSLD